MITPQALTGIELQQQHIDAIAHTVSGGIENVQDIHLLSPVQEDVLFHYRSNEKTGMFLNSELFELQSNFVVIAFLDALQKVIDRHDILRTALLLKYLPIPVQVVQRSATLPVEWIEAAHDCNPVDQLKKQMKQHAALDLARAPLMRVVVAGRKDSAWCVLLQVHSAVCDCQTMESIVAELMIFIRGGDRELSAPRSYRDCMTQVLAQARTLDAEKYYRSKFGDVDEATAPFGFADIYGDGSQIEEACQEVSPELAGQIYWNAEQLGVSAAGIFHAAWGLVVAKTSGREDIVYGTVLTIRNKGAQEHALSLSRNTLPLRLQLQNASVEDLVNQAHRELHDLEDYAVLSLALAQRRSGIAGAAPLFSSVLRYQFCVDETAADVTVDGIRIVARQGAWPNYPIVVRVDDQGGKLALLAQVDRRIGSSRVLGHLRTALESIVASLERCPNSPALALSILSDKERRQVIDSFNATSVPCTEQALIHEMFEKQVDQTPNAVAVVCGSQQLTYAQLNRRCNQLAHALLKRGIRPDDRVGLCVERSVEMVVGFFGILKAGGAYVPLDGSYPLERLRYMLRDCAPVVVVTLGRFTHTVTNDMPVIALDVDGEEIGRERNTNLDAAQLGLTARHLASIIYTSGSTGMPKGVMVEHAGLSNLAYVQKQTLDVQPHSRVLQFASLSFDACTWEHVMALCCGASLYVPPRGELMLGEPLLQFLCAQRITHATLPPVALSTLSSSNDLHLSTLVVAGEIVPPALAQRWAPGRRLINAYGPTEATVCASMHQYEQQDVDTVPIGRPIANAQMYILDNSGSPAPIGVIGDIYIGGVGVTRGYLRQPELTAQRYVINPLSGDCQGRLYKTGDLGRWRTDGTIEFLGRNDHQVKVRGFRIELGEIEIQLTRNHEVREAVVIAREDVPGEKCLVAYVTPRGQHHPSVEELRIHVKSLLPEYMVPSRFVIQESLPLTLNGKVDRRALAAPQLGMHVSGHYEPPQGDVEERLAEIWKELLRVERVGRHDSFFELGGYSLVALKSLFKINQSFGCSLRVTDIYKYPTVQELAENINGSKTKDEFVDLSREAVLDASIVPTVGNLRVPEQNVLLTGSTGFIGRFLLAQLLQDTDAKIYCLVRAQSTHHAFCRLRATMLKWKLWRDEFERRIVAVPGDLGLASFGVDEVIYEALAQEIDSIYHCATSMNHLETYAMAKLSNVEGARKLLNLATRQRPKSIHYISSLSIFSPLGSFASRVVNELSSIDHEKHSTTTGYVASKWVAEKLFMIASERGIPCNIFRLGLVWADSQQGRYDELQQSYRIFKSCLLSGYGIKNYQYPMAPIPVDYAVRAIVSLANRHYDGRGIFHISGVNQLPAGVFEHCNETIGTSLIMLPYYDWIQTMKLLHVKGQSVPALPLIEFAFSMDEKSFNEYERNMRATSTYFDCNRTLKELEGTGILPFSFNGDQLELFLRNMSTEDDELKALAVSSQMSLSHELSNDTHLSIRPSARDSTINSTGP